MTPLTLIVTTKRGSLSLIHANPLTVQLDLSRITHEVRTELVALPWVSRADQHQQVLRLGEPLSLTVALVPLLRLLGTEARVWHEPLPEPWRADQLIHWTDEYCTHPELDQLQIETGRAAIALRHQRCSGAERRAQIDRISRRLFAGLHNHCVGSPTF